MAEIHGYLFPSNSYTDEEMLQMREEFASEFPEQARALQITSAYDDIPTIKGAMQLIIDMADSRYRGFLKQYGKALIKRVLENNPTHKTINTQGGAAIVDSKFESPNFNPAPTGMYALTNDQK